MDILVVGRQRIHASCVSSAAAHLNLAHVDRQSMLRSHRGYSDLR
jgi:hypothetical protein